MKEYDICIFGASSFTGKLVCAYIARLQAQNHADIQGVTFCLAGRNAQKVREVGEANGVQGCAVEVADIQDEASIDNLARKSKCILTLVGPYSKWGEPVVKACVEYGTHYVDISGETFWMAEMREKYDKQAQEKGCTVVQAAGMDSVPCDVCAWATLEAAQEACDLTDKYVTLVTQIRYDATAAASNGTVQSMLECVLEGTLGVSKSMYCLVSYWSSFVISL